MKRSIIPALRDALFIALGVFSAAFGLESFLLPNGFLDGGATGIALLLSSLTHVQLAVLLVVLNIPFIVMGYRLMSRDFAIRTAVAIGLLATITAVVHFPQVTQDKLLVAVFGGFFLGLGMGLVLRGGAVIDGTEVLAITVSKRMPMSIGDVVTLMNVLIFGAAAALISVDVALYSMITYFAASKTVDFVVEGIEEYIGFTIISPRNQEIRDAITSDLGRSVTIYKGQRGFGKDGASHEVDIIYCLVTRLEVAQLTSVVERIDENAFVVMSSVKDTRGGIVKKRRHKH